jgi:hypothetical protein
VQDPGWLTNEAARIRGAADPRIQLYFTYCHNRCDIPLVDTLLASGGRITRADSTSALHAYELHFR